MSAKPSRREQLRGAIAGPNERPGATIKLEFHISPTQAKALEFLLKQFGASRADFVKLLPARGQRPTSTQIHIMDALVTIQHAIELHRIEKRNPRSQDYLRETEELIRRAGPEMRPFLHALACAVINHAPRRTRHHRSVSHD